MDEQINQKRAKWIRWRDKFYEQEAAKFSRVFGVFRFEDACMKRLDKKANCEDASNDHIRRYKRYSASGRFRDIFKRRAAKWEYVKSAGTTYVCNACGHRIEFGATLVKNCPGCGAMTNQDTNAARNIQESQEVVKVGPKEATVSEKTESDSMSQAA